MIIYDNSGRHEKPATRHRTGYMKPSELEMVDEDYKPSAEHGSHLIHGSWYHYTAPGEDRERSTEELILGQKLIRQGNSARRFNQRLQKRKKAK